MFQPVPRRLLTESRVALSEKIFHRHLKWFVTLSLSFSHFVSTAQKINWKSVKLGQENASLIDLFQVIHTKLSWKIQTFLVWMMSLSKHI